MKAIILAAGQGTRLREIFWEKPKPLFEIGGRSLLERSLDSLTQNGIRKITIAVGYNGNLIREKIGGGFKGASVSYANNEIHHMTGSMHSLYKAIDTPQECLVLDGDIVYPPEIINEIVNHKEENLVLLTRLSQSGDEVHALLDEHNVRHLTKGYKGEEKSFEFTGISKFSAKFLQKIIELHLENIENGKFGEYY